MLNALTGIRFVAALLVVLFHFLYFDTQSVPIVGSIIGHGYIGVTMFFVLSGFIMVYANSKRDLKKADFYWARFARLYPLYLFSLVVALPFFIRGFIANGISPEWIAALVLTPLGLQAWVPGILYWNSPAWSLSVEMLWYFLFPFLFPFIRRLPDRILPAVILLIWLTGIIAPAVYQIFLPDGPAYDWRTSTDWIEFVKFNPLVHLSDFLIGAMVGQIFVRKMKYPPSLIMVSGIVLISVMIFSRYIPYIFVHNGLLALLFAGFIFYLATESSGTGVLKHPLLVRLGEASYALYILHVPLHAYWSVIIKMAGIDENVFTNILYVIVAIMVSVLAYLFVERPAQRFLLNWRRKKDLTITTPVR